MPVRNLRKAGGRDSSPTRHHAAPNFPQMKLNLKPTTSRGRRRSEGTEEYQANLRNRRNQSCPAAPAMKAVKGPSSQAKRD